MNQKVVIYIILSAILLYLYYRRKDGAIFAAFVVMVAGTMFASASAREGFGFGGGGGGGDKECAKLGFITPKIDKKDINGSLDKILKNFKKVVEKYADVGEGGIDIEKSGKEIKTINTLFQPDSDATLIRHEWEKASGDDWGVFIQTSFMIFSPYIFRPSEKDQKEIIKDLPRIIKERIKKIINVGNMTVKMLEDTKKLDEVKQLDKKAKTVLDVSICSFKQVVLIWKSLDKAIGGGGGDGGDEEEKSNKKKKSTNKKKSKKDDDDADADADAEDE